MIRSKAAWGRAFRGGAALLTACVACPPRPAPPGGRAVGGVAALLTACVAGAPGAWPQGGGDDAGAPTIPQVVQDFALAARTGDLAKVKQFLARGVRAE